MVGQHNTDRLQSRLQRARGIQILGTWQRVAARVVVRQNDRGRVLVERGLDDFSHADGGRCDAPTVHRHTADGLAFCVQTQKVHDLLLLAVEERDEVLPAFTR